MELQENNEINIEEEIQDNEKNLNADLKDKIKKEMSEIIWSTTPVDKSQKTKRSKRQKSTIQTQTKNTTSNDKDWVNKLPDEKKCKQNDVWYFVPQNKFGLFQTYGKKQNIFWLNMYKKNSFDFMSRAWSLNIDVCELVERDGKIVNPDKFYKDHLGYHLKNPTSSTEVATDISTDVSTDVQ